jgi:hypothetical protein
VKGGLGIVMGWVHGGGDSEFTMFRGAGREQSYRLYLCLCGIRRRPVDMDDGSAGGVGGGGNEGRI